MSVWSDNTVSPIKKTNERGIMEQSQQRDAICYILGSLTYCQPALPVGYIYRIQNSEEMSKSYKVVQEQVKIQSSAPWSLLYSMHTLPVVLSLGDSPFKAPDIQLKSSTSDVGGNMKAVQQGVTMSSTSLRNSPKFTAQPYRVQKALDKGPSNSILQ